MKIPKFLFFLFLFFPFSAFADSSFPPSSCSDTLGDLTVGTSVSLPVTICGVTYTDVMYMSSSISSPGVPPSANLEVYFFNRADVTKTASGFPLSYPTIPWLKWTQTHGAYIYGCETGWSTCVLYPSYVPDRGSASYTTTKYIFHSSYDWGGAVIPDMGIPTPPENDSILSPASGSYLPIGQQTFSGECTHSGLHYAMNWRDFNYPSTPTITCQEDYTWSTTYEVLPSSSSTRAYYFYNYETEQSIFVDIFGMDPQTYLWGLSFLYPDVDSSGYAKLKISNSFPFRLKYNLPIDENKNDYDIEIRDTSAGTVIVSYPLASSDSDSLGYIERNINIVSGINDYTFSLKKGTEEKFSLSVNWEGVADLGSGVYDSVLPDQQDLGFWGNLARTLFIPRFGFIDTRLTTLSSDFSLHFGDFSGLKDSFVSVFSSVSDSGTAPSGSFTWHGWNLNVLNFTMIDSWIGTMKGIEIAVLWVLTFFVILRKLSTIFSV